MCGALGMSIIILLELCLLCLLGVQVVVKILHGNTFKIEVEESSTILNLKEKVEEKEGILSIEQRVVFMNKMLEDDQKLSNYNIQSGSMLYLWKASESYTLVY